MVLSVLNIVKRSEKEAVKSKFAKLVEALVAIKDIGYVGRKAGSLNKTSIGKLRAV